MPMPVKDVVFVTQPGASAAPTGFSPITQVTLTLAPTTSTVLVAADATRRFLNITNNTPAVLYLAFGGGAASAASYGIPPGATFGGCVTHDNKMWLSEVRGYSVPGGDVGVLEAQ